MKRGIMKKIAVMLLISMMIASATACRGGDNVSSSGGSSMAVGSETSASGEDVYSSGEVVSVDSSGNIVSADGTSTSASKTNQSSNKTSSKGNSAQTSTVSTATRTKVFQVESYGAKETARPTTDRQLPPPSMPPNRIPALKKWCNLKQTLPIV